MVEAFEEAAPPFAAQTNSSSSSETARSVNIDCFQEMLQEVSEQCPIVVFCEILSEILE